MEKNRLAENRISVEVISLPESEARRASVARQLDPTGLSWSFFEAIKPSALDAPPTEHDKRKRQSFTGYPMSEGEIGCFLSHRALWREVVSRQKSCLILEDDFVIAEGEDLAALLALIAPHLAEFGFIRLHGIFPVASKPVRQLGGHAIVKTRRDPAGTLAYLVAPAAARRLLDASARFFVPVDDFLAWSWRHKQGIFSLHPYPIRDAAVLPGAIRDRAKPRLSGAAKLRREMYRAPIAIRKSLDILLRWNLR
jgi:glycosyl transferase family 25